MSDTEASYIYSDQTNSEYTSSDIDYSDYNSNTSRKVKVDKKIRSLIADNRNLKSSIRNIFFVIEQKKDKIKQWKIERKEKEEAFLENKNDLIKKNVSLKEEIAILKVKIAQAKTPPINGYKDTENDEKDEKNESIKENEVLSDLQNVIEELKSNRLHFQNEVEQAKQREKEALEKHKIEIEKLHKEHKNNSENERMNHLQKMRLLETEIKNLQANVQRLMKENEIFNSKEESLSQEKLQLDIKCQSLQKQYDDSATRCRGLEAECNELRNQQEGKESSLTQLFEVYDKTRQELEMYKSRGIVSSDMDHLTAKIASYEESLQHTEKDLQKTREENELYKTQMMYFKNDFEREQRERKIAVRDRDQCRLEMNRMRHEFTQLQMAQVQQHRGGRHPSGGGININ